MSKISFAPRERFALAIGIATLLYCAQGFAQGATMEGGIQVGVLNTDNVFLVPPPGDTDDTIFQASPYLDLSFENQRVNASVNYRFDWYDYLDLGVSNEFHQYDATFMGVLAKEALYLDIGASKSQSVVDPDIVIPPESLPGFGNVGDRDSYFYSPRFEKTFGRSVTVNANYRYEDVSYDEADFSVVQAIQDNVNESAQFEVQNYEREEGLTWAARYEWNETEYDLSLPWEYQRATVELGFWISERARVFVSVGKESAWDDSVDRSLQDQSWEAGFAYRNGEKLDAEFAVGERSFGSSWRGRLAYSFRRGRFSVSYEETPTTVGQERLSRFGVAESNEPNDLLARPGSSERYILNRGQASVDFEFRRTSLGFALYDEDRTNRFTDDGIPVGDESQNGASIRLSYQLGAKSELAAIGAVNSREFAGSGKQNFITGGLTGTYQFRPSLGMIFGYSYSEQDPDAGSSGRDYVSNVVSLFLNYTF